MATVEGNARRAAAIGALVAPLTLGVLISLPFIAPFVTPRGDSPSAETELLVHLWRWEKYAGAALWGAALGWIVGQDATRMSAAGLAGMAVGDAAMAPIGDAIAPLFVGRPNHVEMAVTFPVAAVVVVAAMGIAFALAARRSWRGLALAVVAPIAGGCASLLAIAALDAVGVTTGTGSLAMPKVFVAGTLAACAAVGAAQAAALSAPGGRPLRA